MTPQPARFRHRAIALGLAATLALGATACGGSDDDPVANEPAAEAAADVDVDEILARIRSGDFVLPDLSPVDETDDSFVPMPLAEQQAALNGRRYLVCSEWGIRIAEDSGLTTACNSWEFSADLPPIGRLDLRCTWCPESLPTGLDAPERPIFRPIDLDDPARFWDNADNAIRLQALYDSARAGRSLPNELPDWLRAVRANRPATLTSAQRFTDDMLRAVLAVF